MYKHSNYHSTLVHVSWSVTKKRSQTRGECTVAAKLYGINQLWSEVKYAGKQKNFKKFVYVK